MRNQRMMKSVSALAIAAVTAFASVASADVVLKDASGGMTLEGQLLSFDEATYTIKTNLGELIVRREFVTCEGEECPTDKTVEVIKDSTVILTSGDQTVRIKGKLLDTTATEFVVDTDNGILRVRREFVSCDGAACTTLETESVKFSISVPGIASAQLVSSIIGDYAATKDFNLTQQFGNENGLPNLLVGDERGLEVARADLKRMSTSDAVKALFADEIAFAITRDRVSAKQVSQASGKTVSNVTDVLQETVVGLDAISFVVGKNTGMDVIQFEAIDNILRGKIVNWSQVGTANAPVSVHMIADSEGLVDALKERGVLRGEMISNITLHSTAEAFSAAVNSDPTAFGVVYRSNAKDVKALNLASACQIFVDNSDFAVQTEEHPLTVRIYKYERKDVETVDFAANVGRFIVTDFGQDSIASNGLVTQALQISPMQNQGSRLLSTVLNNADDRVSRRVMRNYLEEASTARRISTSLRFVTGNATLDTKAISDLERISEIVRSNDYEGYEVLVFGFSDSYGRLDTNLSLSERRAEAVRQILLSTNSGYLDANSVRSIGAGPIAPVGCNTTDVGRQQNRRVEIWLRPKVSGTQVF